MYLNQWSYSEVQVFLAQMRNGLRDPEVHSYFEVYVDLLILFILKFARPCRSVQYEAFGSDHFSPLLAESGFTAESLLEETEEEQKEER